MVKMRKYISAALLCLTIFMLAGCGGNNEKNNANEPEAYTEPNPYKDGMTLEEAKESTSEYGSMFIKNGDKFYPLVTADVLCNWGDQTGHMTIGEYDYDRNIYTIDAEDENNINTLDQNSQLVEVIEENSDGYFEKLNGSKGYTISDHLIYKHRDVQYHRLAVDSNDDADCEKINGQEFDLSNYKAFSDVNFDGTFGDFGRNFTNLDINGITQLGKAKLAYINYGMYIFADNELGYIFDLEKNEEITIQTREEGSADIEKTTYKADLKYFNYPNDLLIDAPEITEFSYETTDDGYLILNSYELEPGYYVTNNGYSSNCFMFRVK